MRYQGSALDGRRDRPIGPMVEDCRAVSTVARGSEWVEQRGAHRVMVERVEVVALGGVGAPRVSRRTRVMEAVDRRPEHVAASLAQDRRELVCERRLAGSVRPGERDSCRMVEAQGIDQRGEPEELGAGGGPAADSPRAIAE